MKNIQVIDGADNCAYSIFAVTDAEFEFLFPATGQNIEFIEDAVARVGDVDIGKILNPVWSRPVAKRDAVGIHGTLFYGLLGKKKYYPTKIDSEMIVVL